MSISTAYSCSLEIMNASSMSRMFCSSFSRSHTRMHKSHVSFNTCQCLCQTTPIFKCVVQRNEGPSSIKIESSTMKTPLYRTSSVMYNISLNVAPWGPSIALWLIHSLIHKPNLLHTPFRLIVHKTCGSFGVGHKSTVDFIAFRIGRSLCVYTWCSWSCTTVSILL